MGVFTSHELALMKKMTPQNKVLVQKLSKDERQSLEKNVNVDNISLIQSWLGTKEETEKIIFWDKGGKYDDPDWKHLQPFDQRSEQLFRETKKRYEQLRSEAVEVQMRSDLTLQSQFNYGLLFTGMAGAIRCSAGGEEDNEGQYFRGVELRCIGSIEENINSITIHPFGPQELEVHFGSRVRDKPQGILVHTGDSFSLIQLARLVEKDLPKIGYETVLKNHQGEKVSLDAKAIRKAARKGEVLGYEQELVLHASALVQSIGEAIQAAEKLSRCFYERFGLETECSKIGKKYKNFFIMRDDNFDQLLPRTPIKNRGLVLSTATLVCRRCRREIEGFRDLAKSYPDITFILVNLTSPQSKFYKRVFADMGGGDPKYFRDHAVGSTPFIIFYTRDENGVLQFAGYYGTEKSEAPPSSDETVTLLNKYIR